MTVVGNVASEPQLRVTTTGARVGSFRLAVTERRFDKALSAWRDGDTTFYTRVLLAVRMPRTSSTRWRRASRSWCTAGSGTGPSSRTACSACALEIDAFTVGHDLTRGVGTFTRATGPRREEFVDEQPAAASGARRATTRRACRGSAEESSSSAA